MPKRRSNALDQRRKRPPSPILKARIGYMIPRSRPSLARALTHLSAPATGGRTARTPTSGWSSSATACSASPSRRCSTRPFPGERRRIVDAARRAGAPRDLRRSRRDWEVGPHVVLGQGEARAGGRKKAAILADICESLIGAVYLEAASSGAREVVRALGRAHGRRVEPERDAKTAMQEWAQARAPDRADLCRGRAQRARATRRNSSCRSSSRASSRSAAASSKRAAEQAAAQAFWRAGATS